MTTNQLFERVAKEAVRIWKAKITPASLWDIARSFAWAEGFGRKRVVRVQKLALELSKEN